MSKIVFRLLVKFYGTLYCLFLPFAYVALDFFFPPSADSKTVTLLSDDVTAWHVCAWMSAYRSLQKMLEMSFLLFSVFLSSSCSTHCKRLEFGYNVKVPQSWYYDQFDIDDEVYGFHGPCDDVNKIPTSCFWLNVFRLKKVNKRNFNHT